MKGLTTWARGCLHRLGSGRYPAEPVALFRIAGAVVAFLDVQATWDLAPLLWGTWRSLSILDAAYASWSVVLILLALGYRTTLMAVFNYCLTFPLILHLPHVYEYHFDYYLRTFSLYLVFLQSGRAYSLDSLIARWRSRVHGTPVVERTVPLWLVVLFAVHFSLDYFDAGYRKLLDQEMWAWGFGLYWPIVERFCSTGHGEWMLDHEWLMVGASHLAMWLELLFPLLLVWRPTRIVALWLGVGLHVGIVYLFPIRYFGEFMLALYLIFVPISWIEAMRGWIGRRIRRRVVEYDCTCTACVHRAHWLDLVDPAIELAAVPGHHLKWRLWPGRHASGSHDRGPEPSPAGSDAPQGADGSAAMPDRSDGGVSSRHRVRLVWFFAVTVVLILCKLGHIGKLPV